jgi:VIT1/CCC1 family predicted Fe2+/Mn2+ transporter
MPLDADGRRHLLDPVDRISEVLFGLMMAVTIVGSLAVATAEKAEVHTVLYAALGCNLAWGLVDAVMYLMRTATERSRMRTIGQRIRASDPGTGQTLIAGVLPDHLAPFVAAGDLEAMRGRIVAQTASAGPILRASDFLAALAIFAWVVLATFPVVLPFMLMKDMPRAFGTARIVTVVMLALAGYALGRYAAHPRPFLTGASMAVFGVLLITVVKVLGG